MLALLKLLPVGAMDAQSSPMVPVRATAAM